MKTGYKTTEFWITLIASFIGMLVMFGVVTPESQQQLVDSSTQIINAVFAIVPLVAYIIGRSWLKGKEKEKT